MPRPAGNADKLLLAAAKEIARAEGCSGLRIRDVADQAGVNLGMFHYHFKNKKRFTRVLLEEMYEQFFERLSKASREGNDGITQLRASLVAMARFLRDERALVTSIIKDVLSGDQEVVKFAATNFPRHFSLMRELITRCQKEGSLPEMPFPRVMAYLSGGLKGPILVSGMLEKTGAKLPFDPMLVLSDEAFDERVDMLLSGLKSRLGSARQRE